MKAPEGVDQLREVTAEEEFTGLPHRRAIIAGSPVHAAGPFGFVPDVLTAPRAVQLDGPGAGQRVGALHRNQKIWSLW